MTHLTVTYQRERDETKPTHDYLPRGRSSTAPSGTASIEEKPLPEYLSLLQESDCREAGATGGSQMKSITIRFTDVEAAMLIELKRKNNSLKDFQRWVADKIKAEYRADSTNM